MCSCYNAARRTHSTVVVRKRNAHINNSYFLLKWASNYNDKVIQIGMIFPLVVKIHCIGIGNMINRKVFAKTIARMLCANHHFSVLCSVVWILWKFWILYRLIYICTAIPWGQIKKWFLTKCRKVFIHSASVWFDRQPVKINNSIHRLDFIKTTSMNNNKIQYLIALSRMYQQS